jgi:hypothetical protein
MARIAVTGVGIVSALGTDARTTFRALVEGTRGFGPVTRFDVSGERTQIAAEVRGLSGCAAYAERAAREAIEDAGIDADLPLAVVVGTTAGGMLEAEASLQGLDVAQIDSRTAARYVAQPLSAVADHLARVLPSVHACRTLCSARCGCCGSKPGASSQEVPTACVGSPAPVSTRSVRATRPARVRSIDRGRGSPWGRAPGSWCSNARPTRWRAGRE